MCAYECARALGYKSEKKPGKTKRSKKEGRVEEKKEGRFVKF